MYSIINFAHANASHSHGAGSHSHLGPATIFWLAIITITVMALLTAIVFRLSKKPQTQEEERKESES